MRHFVLIACVSLVGCATTHRGELAFEEALSEQLSGHSQIAQNRYREAIAAGVNVSAAWNNLAVLSAKEHDLPSARVFLRNALQANGDDVVAEVNLAVVSASLGDVDGARALLRDATDERLRGLCQIPSPSRVNWDEQSCEALNIQLRELAHRCQERLDHEQPRMMALTAQLIQRSL